MIALLGLSCSIRDSSKITSRSRSISAGTNADRNAMSDSSLMPRSVASRGSVR